MIEQFTYQKGVTLAGGAPFTRDDLTTALALAPHPVAADGGADGMLVHGITPALVIGDMDSRRTSLPPTTKLVPVAEQETTDFGKCLARINAPLYIGVGFLGGRLDHTLAALSVLLTYANRRIILLGKDDIAFIAPPECRLAVEPGMRVSFYPLAPCRGVASTGLRWPIDGLSMVAGGQIGTSNESIASEITAHFEPNTALTLLPRCCLHAVAQALQ